MAENLSSSIPRRSYVRGSYDKPGLLDRVFSLDKRLLLAAAIIVVAIIIIAIRGCSGGEAQTATALEGSSSTTRLQEGFSSGLIDPASIDEGALRAVLDDEYADALLEAAKNDQDAAWIAAHPDAYAVDGEMVQHKLLKLAATEPEARTFVREWPEKYPMEEGLPCESVQSGTVPLLFQWDPKWGYTQYCNTTFAVTGCCPTSLAMVYQGLTGRNDLSPYDLGVVARERGYMDEYNGTAASFLTDYAPEIGLVATSIDVSPSSLSGALSSGKVVICNVGPGDFTTGGHYIVLTGLDSQGKVRVNDPYSAVRSSSTWDIDTIIGQTKSLVAYGLA